MKILFVVSNLYIRGNGLSVSARRTIQALRDAGHDVRVLSGANSDPEGPQPEFCLKQFHFPIFQPIITAQGFSFAKSDPKIINEAVSWADVVHIEEPFPLEYKALKAAQRLGKPVTTTYHIHPENILSSLGMRDWHWPNSLMLRTWCNLFYRHCAQIQCPTQNVQDRLMRYHVHTEQKVISNGVIPDACTRPDTPPADYYDDQRPLDVLYIGRLSCEKDQPTLLEAMRYSKFAKRIRLHFAGQGPRAAALKRQAKRLCKEGVLKYEPVFAFHTRDELRELAAHTDLCIHCATIEVEGLSIMEAIQQGAVPVIAVGRYTGTSQFALDSRSKFPEKNPEALAARIDYWLSHPKERWEMSKRYAESMHKYDIAASAQALTAMFEEAVKMKR